MLEILKVQAQLRQRIIYQILGVTRTFSRSFEVEARLKRRNASLLLKEVKKWRMSTTDSIKKVHCEGEK